MPCIYIFALSRLYLLSSRRNEETALLYFVAILSLVLREGSRLAEEK